MLDILITIAGVIGMILIWIMLYDSNRFVVVQHTFCDRRIRKKFRVVVLADLHDKQYGRGNDRLLTAIEEQKPDAVLIAGDMITAGKKETNKNALAFMEAIAAKYPVYYGNGNHEHRLKLYPKVYGAFGEEYENFLLEKGIEPLVNQHVKLQDHGIVIFGSEIDKEFYKRFKTGDMQPQYLEKLLGKPKDNDYNVLLAHNPDYFPQYAKWGADLVLSGHIHGGMVRIPGSRGVVSPSVRFFPRYDGGIFQEGKSTMLLSRGLGMHTIPIRLFNPGELLVVDFIPEEIVSRKAHNEEKDK